MALITRLLRKLIKISDERSDRRAKKRLDRFFLDDDYRKEIEDIRNKAPWTLGEDGQTDPSLAHYLDNSTPTKGTP